MEEEKDEECGDTPAERLTHSLLMQTAPQRATTSRRRQDSREYRCVLSCSYEAEHGSSNLMLVLKLVFFFIIN